MSGQTAEAEQAKSVTAQKKKKENKNLRRAHPSASPSPSSLLGASRHPVAGVDPRNTRRRSPFRARVLIRAEPAPSPYPRSTGIPAPNPSPSPPPLVPAELHAAADSPPSVSRSSIPCGEIFSSLSSFDFGPHPALFPPLQGRRRAGPPAAAPAHRAAPSPPFPTDQPTGEARRHLLHPVRTSPSPLSPRLVAPPRAAAARRRRARACAPAPRDARRRGRAHRALAAPRRGSRPLVGLDSGRWVAGQRAPPVSACGCGIRVRLAV